MATNNRRCARHSLVENIDDAKRFCDDPTLGLPETVDNILDYGLEDVPHLQNQIPIGDGCSHRSGRLWQ